MKELTLERQKIKEAMGFALEHADTSTEVVQVIADWLTVEATKDIPIPIKVARLYLISDILHNSSAPVPNASSYRRWYDNGYTPQ